MHESLEEYIVSNQTKKMSHNQIWSLACPEDPVVAEFYQAELENRKPCIVLQPFNEPVNQTFIDRMVENLRVNGLAIPDGMYFI